MTSVLYDVPGPKAIARNRVLGAATVLVILGILGWVVWRLLATGQFTADKWNIFTYGSVWTRFFDGMLSTLSAFAVAAVGSLIVGFVLGVGRLSDHAWVRIPVGWIVEVLRAVPVLIFMMLIYYGLPVIGIKLPAYWAVVIALVAYNGSVLAEVFRAGVESLPRGQKEAGYAIGLRKSGVMWFILMPQAVRAMMPIIVAQLVVTLKDTALGFIITYQELLYVINLIGNQPTYGTPLIPAAMVGGTMYVALCLILSYIAHRLQTHAKKSPKQQKPTADQAAVMHEGTNTELIAQQRDFDELERS